MRVDAQPAFVLHAQAYRETSLLLDAMTRDHGRVGLIARGVRGARGQPQRALLQPLQPLFIAWSGRGEIAQLTASEAAGAALSLHGNALLSGFYLNELLVRLLPRNECQTALFWRYSECLGAMQNSLDCAWELRRFERDLLAETGYALMLDVEADGNTAISVDAHYRYDAEHGATRVAGPQSGAVLGASLLALASDARPDPAQLRELRGMMRRVLLHHLGGRELRSWRLLADLNSPPPRGSADQSGTASSS